VIDRGYESRPVLKIVANPAPYGDTKHGDRYQLSPRQLVKKIGILNKFDAVTVLACRWRSAAKDFRGSALSRCALIGFLLSGGRRESQTGGVRNWDIRFRRNCLRFDARSATICHWGGLS
jgi:hypothetical protein